MPLFFWTVWLDSLLRFLASYLFADLTAVAGLEFSSRATLHFFSYYRPLSGPCPCAFVAACLWLDPDLFVVPSRSQKFPQLLLRSVFVMYGKHFFFPFFFFFSSFPAHFSPFAQRFFECNSFTSSPLFWFFLFFSRYIFASCPPAHPPDDESVVAQRVSSFLP